MEKIINSIDLSSQIQWVIAIILSILVIATISFWIWNKLSPSKLVKEMTLRTKSWGGMCFLFLFASGRQIYLRKAGCEKKLVRNSTG